MTHTYNITGMTCGGCIAKVKSNLLKMGNVTGAEVQLTAPQATIMMQSHIPTATLQEAISDNGKFTITEAGAGMHHMNGTSAETATGDSYYPIFLIFGYKAGASLFVQFTSGGFDAMQWMQHFMAGFFLVFSFFKLLNLQGFADGYQTYDIVAKKIPAYGFVYPFIELILGILFLTGTSLLFTNIATVIIMGISTIGVANSLLKKLPFQCACLGTIIKLPLSKVTLFEDLLMLTMSAAMILYLI